MVDGVTLAAAGNIGTVNLTGGIAVNRGGLIQLIDNVAASTIGTLTLQPVNLSGPKAIDLSVNAGGGTAKLSSVVMGDVTIGNKNAFIGSPAEALGNVTAGNITDNSTIGNAFVIQGTSIGAVSLASYTLTNTTPWHTRSEQRQLLPHQ
jgi:hypothetical protein